MKILKEFRDFIMTGNVIDLSVAVLLATAVGAVVSGFTQDVMMPIIGEFTGGMDFSDMKLVLSSEEIDTEGEVVKPENAILYGKWINSIINLIIVGFVLFVIVRTYGKIRKKKEEAPAPDPGPSELDILKEIRDELRKK